jgi:hypothetical protein
MKFNAGRYKLKVVIGKIVWPGLAILIGTVLYVVVAQMLGM